MLMFRVPAASEVAGRMLSRYCFGLHGNLLFGLNMVIYSDPTKPNKQLS